LIGRLIGRMPFAPTEEIQPAQAGFALRARYALAQLARSANVCVDAVSTARSSDVCISVFICVYLR